MSHTGATWQEIADQLGYRSRQAAQQAVKRLTDRTPPETVEQARAKHDGALRLLQRGNYTRYLQALKAGDDDTALRYSKELRPIIAERAELAGAYAPERAELDVNVTADPSALIAQTRDRLLAVLAEREQRQLPVTPIIEAEVVP